MRQNDEAEEPEASIKGQPASPERRCRRPSITSIHLLSSLIGSSFAFLAPCPFMGRTSGTWSVGYAARVFGTTTGGVDSLIVRVTCSSLIVQIFASGG